jgi:hypothetical protein
VTLNEKLRLFCSSDRGNDEIENLFLKINSALANGVLINRAIDSALSTIHIKEEFSLNSRQRDNNVVNYLITRHKFTLLQLRGIGYGYVKIAKILRQRKIYNKKTSKAFSPSTIRNVCAVLEKGGK